MHTPTTNPTAALSRWVRFSRMGRGFTSVPLSAGLIAALLFVVFMSGCKEEAPGIVNACVAPTVIRTSPINGDPSVSLNKTNGVTGSVGVAAVKIITATFSTPMNPNSITASTFTVREGANSVSGTVSYTDTTAVFVASNGLGPSLTYTCTITTGAKDLAGTALASNYVWTFTTVAPGQPTLVAPVDGAVNQSVNPTMIWNAVPGAGTYRLQVSASPGFVGTVYNDSNRTSTSQQISGLVVGTTYYWRVNSKVAGGTSIYSSVWRFTTIGPPAAPVLVSPLAAAQNQPTSLTLSWLASTGASTYRLQVSSSAGFAGTVYDDSTITGTSQPITGLTVGTIYYWRVNAKNVAGTSAYSTRSFTTIVAGLQAPLLSAPADAAVNISTSPTLSWNASTGAATYRLQVDTSSVFASTVFDDSTLTGLSQPMSGLTNGQTYYWRVNAKNSGGTSAYSTTWRFTVAAVVPSVNLGTAIRFGSMGGNAGITNQGILTQVNGSIATTAASTLITGFHDGTASPTNVFTETPLNIGAVRDTIYTATAPPGSVAGAVAAKGLLDAQTAYTYLAGLAPGSTPGAGELGGLTLAPGTYTSATTFNITSGDLTLDAQGDANARFVFQVGSALTVGIAGPTGARSVILINGAQPKNVFWQVGSAATINGAGGGTMVGTIIAQSGVTFSTAGNTTITRLEGRALSLVASVTMVNTIINVPLP